MRTGPSHRPVKDNTKLVREMSSRGVLNTDLEALRQYKDKVAAMSKVESVEERLNSMEIKLDKLTAAIDALFQAKSIGL